MSSPLSPNALRAWILDYVSSILETDKSTLSTSAPFDSYGFDSAEVVIMAGAMEEAFGIEIDPNILFEDPSINGVVTALQATRLVVAEPQDCS